MVYVGSGNIEGFTRARLKLFIVTLPGHNCSNKEEKQSYRYALEKASTKGVVKQISSKDQSAKVKELEALLAEANKKVAEANMNEMNKKRKKELKVIQKANKKQETKAKDKAEEQPRLTNNINSDLLSFRVD